MVDSNQDSTEIPADPQEDRVGLGKHPLHNKLTRRPCLLHEDHTARANLLDGQERPLETAGRSSLKLKNLNHFFGSRFAPTVRAETNSNDFGVFGIN